MSDQNMQMDTKYAALVVDDNWYNRDIFRIALETAEYCVTEAEDGLQGISILENQSFNLMVLDLQMPGLDGRAVLSKVRTMPRHKGMRIVIVTANAHMATEEVDALADFVMYKPIDVMEFSRFLHRVRGTTSSRFIGEG